MPKLLFAPVLHGATTDRTDEEDTRLAAVAIHDALVECGFRTAVLQVGTDLAAIDALAARRPDVVFNLVEALDGRCDLAVHALDRLEALGVPVTGASSDALRRTTDKLAAKRELAAAGLPTPAWAFGGGATTLTGSVIVKSVTEHASLGLDAASVVAAEAASAEIGRREARFGGAFFAETFVDGREFNLSILDGAVLPPAEIVFVDFPADRPRIVDWDAKWTAESHAYRNTPRRFDFPATDVPLLRSLEALALSAWSLFGLRGYARVDFRVDGAGRPWILEANANPCLTPDAGFAAAAERAGIGYGELIRRITMAGIARRSARSAA